VRSTNREDPLQEPDLGHHDHGGQREAVPSELRRAWHEVPPEDRADLITGQQAGREVEQGQRGQEHRGSHRRVEVRLSDPISDEGAHGHDEALHAETDPVGRGQHRGSDRSRRSLHEASGGFVEPQRDGDGNVDDEVDPQDLQRIQRDPPGDVEDAGADEDRDIGDPGSTSGTAGT
jgi:hypothetical protein